LREEVLYRRLRIYPEGFVDFSSNDYLGLSRNEDVINAGCRTAVKYGAGSTGSRAISGNKEIYVEFERAIAKDKHTEAAMMFSSGYQANAGALACLADRDTVVIFDKLNHASMYQGAFASGAKLLRFEHVNYAHLERMLEKLETRDILIATDTVFGMDGDIADIQKLLDLAEKYEAILYLDEAHATGLYGKRGYGLAPDLVGSSRENVVIMGTFSKAIGGAGAYIACPNIIKEYMLQRCGNFIYSTAPSPFCVGAAMHSWGLIGSMDETRRSIMELASTLRTRLQALGFKVKGDGTNIVPVLFNNAKDMMAAKERCLESEIVVAGIGKPTSPTPRIRIAINASHGLGDVEKVAGIFASL
jgi:8-amino-7-oxononanoate synthase